MDEARKHNPEVVFIAAGNTSVQKQKRVVSVEEAHSLFESMDPPVPYFETSGEGGRNIKTVFENAVRLAEGKYPILNDNSLPEEHHCIIS